MIRPEEDRLVASAEDAHPDGSPLPAGPDARARGVPASDDVVTPAGGDGPAGAGALRERWRDIQSGFVDDPPTAVASADDLVRETLHATPLAESGTEPLRQALRGYRTVLESLLTGARPD